MRAHISNRSFSETFPPVIFVIVLAISMTALALPMGGVEASTQRPGDCYGRSEALAGRGARSCGREVIDFVDPRHNTDTRVTYEGLWMAEAYNRARGGKLVVCHDVAAAVEVTFHGWFVRLVAARYWTCGKCAVYLDGEYRGTVNLHSEWARYNSTVFWSFLPCGQHTLRLVNLGEPGSEYPYHFVNVDYMVVW